jgi:putative ABC transport system ATP-binding protein
MKVVVVDKIHKQYHDHVIFDDFSMEIEQGSFVAIQGASGSGKSTLLNMIGLLDSPDKGNIVIFDKKNVKPFSRQANKLLKAKIGYLFQNFALIDNKSVYYNLYLSIDHFSFPDKKERILKALEDVGLKGFENKKICECSGGEQQRVALDSSRLSENTEDPRKFNIPWVFSFCQNLRICV